MCKLRTLDITLAAMFVALMTIGANITTVAPFLQVGGIPLSMQPFFAILAGLLLGSRLGSLSMIVYILVGMAGAPVFAGFSGGIAALFKLSGGFILSFVVVAYVVGKLIERKKSPQFPAFLLASLVGIILIYLIGTNFMYLAAKAWLALPLTYADVWKTMSWFMVKDLTLTILGAVISPRIYRAVSSRTSFSQAA